ncbi:hypothetical protein I4U23_031388 [Adineta vaga]|nr:hypothetical protein I4U23_031388 [Adineta vaga]
MSSSNISITEAMIIRQNTVVFIQVWSFMMIILGTIGHIINISVFTRPALRSNSCSWYFLAASISGFCVVIISTPLRLLSLGYGINIFSFSSAACKILTFIVMWARAQYAWFIALACVDRFLCSSSSVKLRALSSPHVASRIIPLAILIVGLAFSHLLVYFGITLPRYACAAINNIYQAFFGIWNLFAYSVGPPIVMLYFGLRTIQHIRQSLRRTGANLIPSQSQRPRQKTTDRQLIQMMLVQCIVFIITASLPSTQYIYSSVRSNLIIDDLQSAKDSAFSSISGFVSLSVPCLGFYLFTLSSKLFRCETKKKVKLYENSVNMNRGNREFPSSSQLTGTHDVSSHGSSIIRVVKSSRLNNQNLKNNTRSTNGDKANKVIHIRIRSPRKLPSVDAMDDLLTSNCSHPQSGKNQSSTVQKSNKSQAVNNTETIQYHQPGSANVDKSSALEFENFDNTSSIQKTRSRKRNSRDKSYGFLNEIKTIGTKKKRFSCKFSKLLVFTIALFALLIAAVIAGITTGIVMTLKNTTTTTTTTTATTSVTTTSQTTETTTTTTTSVTTTSQTTETTTTTTTSVTTTTVTTTTSTRPVICPSAVWHPNGTTVAGSSNGSAGSTASLLRGVYDIRVDSALNVYVADYWNYRFMKWSPSSTYGTVIGPKLGASSSPDTQHLNSPTTLCFDSTESNLYLSDSLDCRILKLNIASGNITVVIGSGCGNALNQINWCDGLYVDRFDNIYVADWTNDRVLKFPPSSNLSTNGVIVAGTGVPGSALNQLDTPWNIYVDESDNDTFRIMLRV